MSGPLGRRGAIALVALLGALMALVGAAPSAQAHAYTIATTPSNGAELNSAPTQIRVTFDEAVTLPSASGSASVLDAAGKKVDTGTVRLVDARCTLVIDLSPGLAHGTYIASWTVISADTHPVGGSLQFGFGVPATALSAPAAEQPSAALELLVGVAKGLVYLALIGALGLVPAAVVLGAEARERRAVWLVARFSAALAIVFSLLQIVTQYFWDASAVPGGATWSGWNTFARSEYSDAIYARIALLALVLVSLPTLAAVARGHWSLPARWAVEGLLALGVLGSVVHNGHGGVGAWWHFASTLVHVTAFIAWLGGLAVLGWLVLRRRLSVRRLGRLPLWSRYAAASVGLLAFTGVVQGVVQVRYPSALVSTTYGYILIVKVVLVAAALVLGWRGNRWIHRQLAAAGSGSDQVAAGQTARLRGRVRSEAGIGAVIVVVAGLLSSVTPAVTAYAPTRIVHAAVGPYTVRIAVAPARRGPQSFRITALGTSASTPPAQSIELDLGQAGSLVQALPVRFPYRLPGVLSPGKPTAFTFVSPAVNVPATGTWTGTLTLIAGPTQQYTDAFEYRVL